MPAPWRAILFVVNDLAYFRAHRLAPAQAAHELGYDVHLLAGRCTETDAARDDPFTLHPLPLDRHRLDPAGDLHLARAVARLIREHRPVAAQFITIKPVLFGGLGMALLAPSALAKSMRIVWTMPGMGKVFEPGSGWKHALRRELTSRGLRFSARRIDPIITTENTRDRDRFVAMNIVPDDRAVAVAGTGLDFNAFQPPEDAHSRSGPLHFAMATRLVKAKGIGAFIDAATALAGPDARFSLAGIEDSTNPDAFPMARIQAAVDAGVLTFAGAVSQARMPDFLGETDIFCLPTELQEGFPRSLMEAAGCGSALIAADQQPIRDVVIEGETGWLLRDTGTDALIAACRTALDDPVSTRAMGVRASEHIRTLPVSEADVTSHFRQLFGIGPDDG